MKSLTSFRSSANRLMALASLTLVVACAKPKTENNAVNVQSGIPTNAKTVVGRLVEGFKNPDSNIYKVGDNAAILSKLMEDDVFRGRLLNAVATMKEVVPGLVAKTSGGKSPAGAAHSIGHFAVNPAKVLAPNCIGIGGGAGGGKVGADRDLQCSVGEIGGCALAAAFASETVCASAWGIGFGFAKASASCKSGEVVTAYAYAYAYAHADVCATAVASALAYACASGEAGAETTAGIRALKSYGVADQSACPAPGEGILPQVTTPLDDLVNHATELNPKATTF